MATLRVAREGQEIIYRTTRRRDGSDDDERIEQPGNAVAALPRERDRLASDPRHPVRLVFRWGYLTQSHATGRSRL
jgi:hypothetical protein